MKNKFIRICDSSYSFPYFWFLSYLSYLFENNETHEENINTTAMKIKLAFIIMLMTVASLSNAQKHEQFIINPGERPVEAIPDSAQYAYPSFVRGSITFRDERPAGTARLNYNYLFEEMMFLNNKEDTLAIADAATIRQIVINADTFYFSNVFVKHAATYGDIKLGRREYFRVANIRKTGAMGLPTSNTVQSYKAASTASDLRTLVVQEVLNLEKMTQFFFGDKFNKFQIANRNNMQELFPEKRKLIKTYLKDNHVNFTQEEDVVKLLVYLQKN